MKNRKVLLLWYQQGDNFGDVLIYQTTKVYLENAGYDVESHEVGHSEAGIAEHANQCGFLLFAGGGIIERYVPRVIQSIRQLKQLLQVPYGVIGVGIGEFDYTEYEDALKYWVAQAEFFYVRDAATRDYLNGISGSTSVIFSGDVVFANRTIAKGISTGCKMGLNMRDIPYTDVQGDFDWNQVNEAVDRVKCDILIPDCNPQTDRLTRKFENMRTLEEYKALGRDAKVKAIISSIQECDAAIAMRFHVVLVSALSGVIPVPILYCPKVRYLAEQLGLMELAIELGEWEKLPRKVELARTEKNKYLENMKRNITVLRENVHEMYEFILNKLEEL